MVSPHVLPLAAALREHLPAVRFVTLGDLDAERRAIGWTAGNPPGVELVNLGRGDKVRDVIAGWTTEADYHILPGVKPAAWLWKIQLALWRTRSRLVPMTESPWPRSSAMNRLLLIRDMLAARAWSQRAHALLAIGNGAADHFRRCGFAAEKIKPFGYFPVLQPGPPPHPAASDATILVAASLMKHKGVDLVLEALHPLRELRWNLVVAGDGPERASLAKRAARLGFSDRVKWLGWVPAAEMAGMFQHAALVVVPSRYDGWGAVTNEALAQGVPVVVSDAAGSHCLVRDERGTVVAVGDVAALTIAIDRELAAAPTLDRRRAIARWAADHIAPEVAAAYLAAILRDPYEAAPPPWAGPSSKGSD